MRILVTSAERLTLLAPALAECHDLRAVHRRRWRRPRRGSAPAPTLVVVGRCAVRRGPAQPHRVIDTDMAAILYTSGSTGKPKGVVLSHRNMVAGAQSVAQYLENHAERPDPVRAAAELRCRLQPAHDRVSRRRQRHADQLSAAARHHRPRSSRSASPDSPRCRRCGSSSRSSSGRQPRGAACATSPTPAAACRRRRSMRCAPRCRRRWSFLMYGLTESFRSTYLPPAELDRRPDSIGKAIPNAEVLVVREDGTPCAPGEPGELVHRGALVSLGYWNDPEKTAERFKPAPGQPEGLVMPEIAVWSGDTVRMDEEGFLYFISRRDEMIKTSGYRVSPTEVEEVIYATKLVGEAAALGIPHPVLGQAIVVVATPRDGAQLDTDKLLAQCRQRLPAFMVPARVISARGQPAAQPERQDRPQAVASRNCRTCSRQSMP